MKRVRKFLLIVLSSLLVLTLTALTADAVKKKKIPKTPSFVGAAKCNGSCHDPWYQALKDTGHAKTYALLETRGKGQGQEKGRDPYVRYKDL